MFYYHINYRYIMGDQRMMSFGFSGSPPPFLANKIWWWWSIVQVFSSILTSCPLVWAVQRT